jgi:hypothetical protein
MYLFIRFAFCFFVQNAVLYHIDEDAAYVPAEGYHHGTNRPSRIGHVKTEDLLSTSFLLDHDDVKCNTRANDSCSECRCLETDKSKLRRCDGVYPFNAGINYPENGEGRQFACHRGVLCDSCAELVDPEATYWLCRFCRFGATSIGGVWGNDIDEPNFLRIPGVQSTYGTPKPIFLHPENEQPADVWLHRRALRKAQREAGERESRRGRIEDSQRSTMACSEFLRLTRNSGFPRRETNKILHILHELNDSGNLLVGGDGTPGDLALPRDSRTLASRAKGVVLQDADVDFRRTFIDQSGLLQSAKFVEVNKADPISIIQDILLDESLPPGAVYMHKRGEMGNRYVSESGTPLRGPEAYNSDRWDQLAETVELGVYLLGVSIHSDAVNIGNHSRYPHSLSVVNIPHKLRDNRAGISKFAVTDKPLIRLPRNSRHHERLSQAQKNVKLTLSSRIFAEVLVDFNEAAKTPKTFLIRDSDGVIRRYRCQLRLFNFSQDMEEFANTNAMSSKDCFDCVGVRNSLRSGGPGTPNRPYMKLDKASYCHTARLRTPEGELALQARCMTLARTESKGAADEFAASSRIRYRAKNSLLVLTDFIPHGACRGPYACTGLDILHCIRTGIFEKLIQCIDSICIKHRGSTRDIRSSEDLRDLTDHRLKDLGNWYNHENFTGGFWGRGDGGGLKGHEKTSLVRLLPFAIVGCPIMIANETMRRRVLGVIWSVLRLLAEIESPQFYEPSEFSALDERVRTCIKGLHYLMDILETGDGSTDGPGHVFDIPKVHLLGGACKFIQRFGSLLNIDTEGGERSMKDIKEADSRVERANLSGLLQRCVSLESDRRLVAEATSGRRGNEKQQGRVTGYTSRRSCGTGLKYSALGKDLMSGANGPVVQDDILLRCDVEIPRLLQIQTSGAWCFAEQAAAYDTDANVDYVILRPGHCVRLRDNNYGQVIIPHVQTALSETTGFIYRGAGERRAEGAVLIMTFQHARPGRFGGNHPEFPVPWLKRGKLELTRISNIAAREHVVPLFGRSGIAESDKTDYFLVNLTATPCYSGDKFPAFSQKDHRAVYLLCNNSQCTGRLSRPVELGGTSTCSKCGKSRVWL